MITRKQNKTNTIHTRKESMYQSRTRLCIIKDQCYYPGSRGIMKKSANSIQTKGLPVFIDWIKNPVISVQASRCGTKIIASAAFGRIFSYDVIKQTMVFYNAAVPVCGTIEDGGRFVFVTTYGYAARVFKFDAATGKELDHIDTQCFFVKSLAYKEKSNELFVASFKAIEMYDCSTNMFIAKVDFRDGFNIIDTLFVDDNRLAMVKDSGRICLWDTSDVKNNTVIWLGEERIIDKEHPVKVCHLRLSADKCFLLSFCQRTHTLEIWNLATLKLERSFLLSQTRHCPELLPCGTRMLFLDDRLRMHEYVFETPLPISVHEEIAVREDRTVKRIRISSDSGIYVKNIETDSK